MELDVLEGNVAWKADPECPYYNWQLVRERLQDLEEAMASKNVSQMLHLVRTALTRQLGYMGDVKLYRHTHIGTKDLIERYVDTTVEMIATLLRQSTRQCPPDMDYKTILNQLVLARQAFGRSALLLSGGGTFGMNHVGVLKSMWQAGLLPRIISGASAGSIVCAVLCTRIDEEIPEVLDTFPFGNMAVFDDNEHPETIFQKIGRFLKHGAWIDICHLKRVMRDILGDMTFQESYNRTRRILNICVSSAGVYELPRLLNYVTAPNVLIWSAVAASCSVPFIFSPAEILVKDPETGEAIRWNPSPQHWIDGSVDGDLPMTRLAEMFNVNHFIVSQVNPHVIPFLSAQEDTLHLDTSTEPTGVSIVDKMSSLAVEEALHRMNILSELGVFPTLMTKCSNLLSQKYSGDITICPEIKFSDLPKVLQNPTSEFMLEACLSGERATWPKLSRIRNHLAIELALDDAVQKLRTRVVFSPSQVSLRLNTWSTIPQAIVSKTVPGDARQERRNRRRRASLRSNGLNELATAEKLSPPQIPNHPIPEIRRSDSMESGLNVRSPVLIPSRNSSLQLLGQSPIAVLLRPGQSSAGITSRSNGAATPNGLWASDADIDSDSNLSSTSRSSSASSPITHRRSQVYIPTGLLDNAPSANFASAPGGTTIGAFTRQPIRHHTSRSSISSQISYLPSFLLPPANMPAIPPRTGSSKIPIRLHNQTYNPASPSNPSNAHYTPRGGPLPQRTHTPTQLQHRVSQSRQSGASTISYRGSVVGDHSGRVPSPPISMRSLQMTRSKSPAATSFASIRTKSSCSGVYLGEPGGSIVDFAMEDETYGSGSRD